MIGRLRARLTFANVVSVIALFAALGLGTAWALERNSVKSKHIVNEQVKTADLRDGAVTGPKLGGDAQFTDAGLPPIGSCASLPDGWYDSAGRPVGYYRDAFGIVHLQGAFQRCGDVPGPAVTLPAGYRPAIQSDFPVAAGASFSTVGMVQIPTSGQVFGNGTAATQGALDGLTFRCGPSGQDGCP